jgi:hypothetical protein
MQEKPVVTSITDGLNHRHSAKLLLRISCALLIVLFGLLSLLFWTASGRIFWLYSCIMVGLDALCCLIIAGWGYEFDAKTRWARVGKQFLHWIGFASVVYLLDSLIVMGTFLPKNAGLILLGLLGFCVYLAGLAIDLWLILVGVVLVLLAMSVVWVHQHVWFLVIPIGVAVVLLLVLAGIIYQRKSKDAQL